MRQLPVLLCTCLVISTFVCCGVICIYLVSTSTLASERNNELVVVINLVSKSLEGSLSLLALGDRTSSLLLDILDEFLSLGVVLDFKSCWKDLPMSVIMLPTPDHSKNRKGLTLAFQSQKLGVRSLHLLEGSSDFLNLCSVLLGGGLELSNFDVDGADLVERTCVKSNPNVLN